jgi:hypothetical protein
MVLTKYADEFPPRYRYVRLATNPSRIRVFTAEEVHRLRELFIRKGFKR